MPGDLRQFLPAKQQASRHASTTPPFDAIACLPTALAPPYRKAAISPGLVDNSFDIHRMSCEQARTCPRTRILYRFAPEKIQGLCSAYFCRKRLIARINSELSTDISAFTTTTIFIYRPIVERRKKLPTAVFSRKPGKHRGKKFFFENRLADRGAQVQRFFRRTSAGGPTREPGQGLVAENFCDRSLQKLLVEHQKSDFCQTAVDKCLHIHRISCGKTHVLCTSNFLSQTRPVWIQCLCSDFFGR